MTYEELINKREEICYKLLEADTSEIKKLEQELMWVEELLNNELEKIDEEQIH
jgi:hypothetical protein